MASLLEISINGLDQILNLSDRIDNVVDVDEITDEAGAILLNRIRTRYLDETDPEGNRWPRSQAAIRRQQTGRGGGTLFDTGAMFHSIQLATRGEGERAILTDVPYARFHQEGEGQERRVFLGFSNEDVDIVNRLVVNRIRRITDG